MNTNKHELRQKFVSIRVDSWFAPSSCVSQSAENEIASVNLNCGPPSSAMNGAKGMSDMAGEAAK
jgi:hypothetical protein